MTPFQAVRTIPPGMKYFTVVDALKGYHQVLLDDESAELTTFSTPFGRYRYLRLPFGITHAGDDYCRRVSDIFDSIPNSRRIVEDLVVFSKTYAEHLELVRSMFTRAKEHNISLNPAKLVFAQPSVKFGGYIIDSDGFRPDPELTRVDASRLYGLGFVLKQQQTNNEWKLVQVGSRFLSDAETRYAMIELECLGAAWAM